MLEEKLMDESIVANHKVKNRRKLIDSLQQNIAKLSLFKKIKEVKKTASFSYWKEKMKNNGGEI